MAGVWHVLGLAAALVVAEALAQRRTGLNLADEGYLWYGSWRTAAGESPMEDFRSYDPGRFHWCAAFVRLFGPGILVVRAAVSVFLALGLWAGLEVARRVTGSLAELALIGILLMVGAHPRWKRFEHALSLVAVLAALLIVENPSSGVLFLAGAAAGLAGYYGRNHAVYFVASQVLAIGYAWRVVDAGVSAADVGAWVLGGVVGYAPMLQRWVRRPASLRFYVREKLLVFVRRGSTNLPRQVPWPWRFRRGRRRAAEAAADLSHRLLLVGAPLALAAGVGWALAGDAPAWVAAVSFVGLPYSHHAFARADVSHLCQALAPFWLGVGMAVATLDAGVPSAAAWLGVLGVAALTACPVMPRCLERFGGVPYVPATVRGERLSVRADRAQAIAALEGYAAARLAPTDAVFLAPHMPGMYVALGRRAPVHNTYLIFPETDERQRRMIADLDAAAVALAVVEPSVLDGRPELAFATTHPAVWQYLVDRFEPAEVPGLDPAWRAFRRPAARPPSHRRTATGNPPDPSAAGPPAAPGP